MTGDSIKGRTVDRRSAAWLPFLRLREAITMELPSPPDAVIDCLRSHVQTPSWRSSLLRAFAPAVMGPFRTFQGTVTSHGFRLRLVLPVTGPSGPNPEVRGVIERLPPGTRVTATVAATQGIGEFVLSIILGVLAVFSVYCLMTGAGNVSVYLLGGMVAATTYALVVRSVYRRFFLRELDEIRRQLEFAFSHKRADL
jgi:hypothetical protein